MPLTSAEVLILQTNLESKRNYVWHLKRLLREEELLIELMEKELKKIEGN
ncbi:MAG: hypothetical protein LBU09_03435 [Endomicrobium sp.]|nr:hypothetical protein [Endomicrobium sp.]